MKTTFSFVRILCLFACVSLIISCSGPLSIVKRRYEPGFYVQWPSKTIHDAPTREQVSDSPILAAAEASRDEQTSNEEIKPKGFVVESKSPALIESRQEPKISIEPDLDTVPNVSQGMDTLNAKTNDVEPQNKGMGKGLGLSSLIVAIAGSLALPAMIRPPNPMMASTTPIRKSLCFICHDMGATRHHRWRLVLGVIVAA